jgi:predicted DCC family thiol-disulfide oxidoreductase YuxK
MRSQRRQDRFAVAGDGRRCQAAMWNGIGHRLRIAELTPRRSYSSTPPYMDAMSAIVVWFDGSCPLCRREIALMRRLDRRGAIDFIDAAEDANVCPTSRADMLAQLHARENGRLLIGAAAFAAMWRAIPLLRPLGLLARSLHMLGLMERLYRVFLRARPWLQRLARSLDRRSAGA